MPCPILFCFTANRPYLVFLCKISVASGPGISGKVREFYLCKMNIAKVSSKFIKWWTKISHACSYITHVHGFQSKNKNKFKLWNSLSFLGGRGIRKCTVTNLTLLRMQGWDFSIWIQFFLCILFFVRVSILRIKA